MVSSHRLVIKDAAWQLIGRIISALFGFLTIKIMTPYLGPLQYGDYSTILKYFAIWTALADLGLYVLAVKRLGAIKEAHKDPNHTELKLEYGKFVGTRLIIMSVVYLVAIIVAYLLPAYTSNPYLVRGLPFGMIFSASFMFAGIQQLPLQIFWRMDQLSWSLITARLSQLAILVPVVYFIFKDMTFNGSTVSLIAFCCIMFSVVASSIGQNIEIHVRSKKLLPLKITFDWKFTKDIIVKNRQYGISYYLSSFHTLIVLLFLGWFYPTSSGHDYTGVWALSLTLIEILLIIPSSLGNSLLHKVSGYSLIDKRKSMGNLLLLIFWIGGVIAVNFWLFADQIILVVSGKAFLGSFASLASWGSNQLLPFLGIVLLRSFIKQGYNYLFVAVEKQNVLLPINLIGVLVGIPLGIRMIPQYGLFGGVVTQMSIELLFMLGAIRVGKRKKVQPIFSLKIGGKLTLILIGMAILGYGITYFRHITILQFFLVALVLNAFVLYISLSNIKKIAKGLTVEDTIDPII
ncbi:MAG TPA: oligosaccharide flippase family protein [Candidatus Absconditabacterales bacterium]|nr:oligosaccharide flippase family protein [Candidatus Absconditabacterales bacterium]